MNKLVRRFLVVSALVCLTMTMGCAYVAHDRLSVANSEKSSAIPSGYLQAKDLPDSLALLPPPPEPDSAFFAADQEAYRQTRGLRGTPRWVLAVKDADLESPEAAEAFSCALDAPITQEATPRLYDLLRRSMVDASRATSRAKDHYRRTRPFVVNNDSSCTPYDEPSLMKNGSYPSGHTSIGWTWALILVEIAPDRTDAILKRGYAFGQSRVICGMHWQSDVEAGRIIAAGVVARLHADPAFRTQLEFAGAELAAVRARGLKPTGNCTE